MATVFLRPTRRHIGLRYTKFIYCRRMYCVTTTEDNTEHG